MGEVPEADSLEPLGETAWRVYFGGLVLDLDASTLARESGEAIPLTRGELGLLRLFVTRPGRVISRSTLLDALANRRFEPFDRSVDVLVGRLRRKIEPDPRRPAIIVTVPGIGYKFAAAVRAETTTPKPEETADKAAPREAERRHVTVLCAELVSAEGRTLPTDPEDLHAAIDAFRRCVGEALATYAGVIGENLGREVVAYFGYPQARENDAERAVRAALAIQRALSELDATEDPPCLSARIGLEAGPVMVDATGEAFGNALTIAAQVRAAAPPHCVLVTGNVQRQIAGLFVAEEQGAHYFGDAPEPLNLYRVVRASGRRRFGARMLTPIVGREEELEHLARRWERARRGQGQFVLIVGEPGIGKSRLIHEFRTRLGEMPHSFIEWTSSQLLQNSPLHPIAEWGRQRFGGADLPSERRLAELKNTLAQIKIDPEENAPLLAPVLDIPLPPERAPTLASDEVRRRQLAALTAAVMASARIQPVVLAIEDLHWADPTTVDLLRGFAERGGQAPLLIMATARPEFRPSWDMRSHHSVISLPPLDPAQVRQMVDSLAYGRALSKDTIEGVSARTGGVPLFVEEVTRLLMEIGEPSQAHSIPLTLQQSLAARLDRLGPAREVAQIGSVLGREFAYPLLRDISELDEPELEAALERLVDADILVVEGVVPSATYRYKHALIRDAAYDTLLRSRQQALHRRAAATLCDPRSEPAASDCEVIARHFTEAGLDHLAIEWWGKAGDDALRRSAYREAIAHLGTAIAMADNAEGASLQQGEGAHDDASVSDCLKLRTGSRLATLSETDTAKSAIMQRRQQLQVAYGNALIAARGFAAPETAAAFAKARALTTSEKDAPERFAADVGLWGASYTRGDLASMREYAAALLGSIDPTVHSPEAGVAYRRQGITHWFAGEYREAREYLERALALFQPGRDDEMAFRFALDPGISTMGSLAFVLWPLGQIDRAVSLIDRMEMRIEGLTYANTRALGIAYASQFEFMCGGQRRLAGNAIKLANIAREHGLAQSHAFAMFLEGSALAKSNLTEGVEQMRRGVESLRECNVVVFDGLVKIALAKAEANTGDVERGVATLDEALATAERLSYRAFQAELHRARGELFVRNGSNLELAEEAFQAAMALAKRQKARSFELRAAVSLARLYGSAKRPADVHAVLAPALKGFIPTREFPEIAEAQTLLTAITL